MYGTGWSETLKWVYDWNPRDQMKQATKYVNTALAGYVEYQYCLSCDGALSKRLQYNSSSQLTSEKRYEYDGINLLRVDERCDADGDGIVEEGETTWRMVEVATHRPGQLGALVGKRVYSYPSAGNRCVSNGYTVYTYGYDAVGNVVLVYTGGGDEAFFFAQDAFGNELDIAAFASSDWVDAREDGVGEHQTGKWIDPFTGQYYFHARWYDSVVGRFTGRDQTHLRFLSDHYRSRFVNKYKYCMNAPTYFSDSNGLQALPPGCQAIWNPGDPAPPVNLNTASYGNYCGRGTNLRLKCPAIDKLDQCCKTHDFCYLKYGIDPNTHTSENTWRTRWGGTYHPDKACCDKAFCDCANALSEHYGGLINSTCKSWQDPECGWTPVNAYRRQILELPHFRCYCKDVKDQDTKRCKSFSENIDDYPWY